LGECQAQGQILKQLPQDLSGDPYAIELATMLDRWNQSTLELPRKSELKPVLRSRVAEVVKIRKYSYETEPWEGKILIQFEELPELLRPEKKLDTSAAMVLMLLFLKGRADFEHQVTLDEFRGELRLPLFLILGRGQALAKTDKLATLDSYTISKSLLDWWTTVWPFCN